MTITLLKSKLHRAVVTQTELDYVGSITLDAHLMSQAGLLEYEKVLVVDINNGSRFETYCLKGEPGSGMVCINGAAARLVSKGDVVIVMAFCEISPQQAASHRPKVLFLNDDNEIVEVADAEKHGDKITDKKKRG
ncbi:MAG: aspartate 1-decarboxylase [Deltaproteobacteria bacterium]|jgi:aspartate 1-decarboxylase|nr:aspartate 1-decarboxylase [Deltaproteobacteria bacterium]